MVAPFLATVRRVVGKTGTAVGDISQRSRRYAECAALGRIQDDALQFSQKIRFDI